MSICKECKIEFHYEELYQELCIVCWANKAKEVEKELTKKIAELEQLKKP